MAARRRWLGTLARIPLATLGAVVAFVGFHFLIGGAACSPEERGVFQEFPQYGDARVTPVGNAELGSCSRSTQAAAPAVDVAEYYRRELGARGWRLTQERPDEGMLLAAERDGFTYEVLYEELPNLTGVSAHVRRR
jgi:hypothetical protein